MLNVRDYSEGWKHQKLNTPNCPTIFPEHYLYVYLVCPPLLTISKIHSERFRLYNSNSVVSTKNSIDKLYLSFLFG